MAISQGKRFSSPAQSRAPKTASSTPQSQPKNVAVEQMRPRRRKELPSLPPPVVSRKGKTTVSRYSNRTFYRMEEVKGKTVDFVEFFTVDGYHAIEIAFEDKTALNLVIEPCFTLDREYSDWKSGNWRPIKQWPLVHSQSGRV